MSFTRASSLALLLAIFQLGADEHSESVLNYTQKRSSYRKNACEPVDEPCCVILPSSYRVGVRHIESKGIGYTNGYTTFEGFFSPHSLLESRVIPFLDARAHVFDDGEPAVNAGVGVRFIKKYLWGANAFYDYRKTNKFHYNQIGIGFEASGELWDAVINGYFPVGGTKSQFFRTRFSHFQRHRMILSQVREFGMTGGNAEGGFHYDRIDNVDLYVGAGPYYFSGSGKSAAGGQVRAVGCYRFLELEVNASYDSVFKGIFQGQIGLNYSFGPCSRTEKRACMTCREENSLMTRALNRANRFEIVVADRKKYYPTAIDPATGEPFHILFVNNLSHSLGTFGSPYNTLSDAETNSVAGDWIYVFSGDGTSNGLNEGITLKDNQRLLGSGVKHQVATTKGEIAIPSMSSQLPHLTNTTNSFVVKLGNNNLVSGLTIDGTAFTDSNAIEAIGTPITNATIAKSVVLTGTGGNAIKFLNNHQLGIVNIENCQVLGADDAANTFGIFLDNISGGSVFIDDCLFSGVDANSGLARAIDVETLADVAEAPLFIQISNNTFSSAKSTSSGSSRAAPIHVANNGSGGAGTALTMLISNNAVDVPSALPAVAGIYLQQLGIVGSFDLILNGNSTSTPSTVPGYRINNYGIPPLMTAQINQNNNGTIEIGKDPLGAATTSVTISNP